MSLATKVLDVLDKAIGGKPKQFEVHGFLRQILKESGEVVANESELATLRPIQADWEKADTFVSSFTFSTTRQAWEQHQVELQAAILGTGTAENAWDRNDFEADFQARLEAAREIKRLCFRKAQPTCATICARFVAAARRLADDTEKKERAEHAAWLVPYTPSALLQTMKKAPEFAQGRCPDLNPHSGSGPAEMLPYLDL